MARTGTLLALALLGACSFRDPPPARDAGAPPRDAGGVDPVTGNPFEGPLTFDDARLAAVDPGTLPAAASPCRAPVLGQITRAIDGDTVFFNGTSEPLSETVRMIGVDTPEVAHSGTPAECFGPEAEAFTRQLEGRTVWLTFDRTCRDPYERLLAYVHVGPGTQDLWERQLLRRGLGTVLVIGANDALEDTLRQDEFVAQRAPSGLWAECR